MTVRSRPLFSLLLISVLSVVVFAQEKRNGRPAAQPAPAPTKAPDSPPANGIEFTYEFHQPAFVVSHVVIQHDSRGVGTISFVQRTEPPIVEPIQLSSAA